MPTKVLTRGALHKLVWERSMRDVASEIGVSDVGLKKICGRYAIPAPPQGYWNRAPAARERPVPLRGGADVSIHITVSEEAPVLEPDEAALLESLLSYEDAPDNRIDVVDQSRLHPHATRIEKALRSALPDKYGSVRCVANDLLSVRVSPQGVDRAVKLADTLYRAFAHRKWQVLAGDEVRQPGAVILIAGERIGISIEETARRSAHRATPEERHRLSQDRWVMIPAYDYRPSDEFWFGLGWRGALLKDKAQGRLEGRLNEFMKALVLEAFERREQTRQIERRNQREAEERARATRLARLREIEKAALNHLDCCAGRLEKKKQILTLVEAAERANLPSELDEDRRRWSEWARSYAAQLDPLGDLKALFHVDFDALDALHDLRA